MGNYFNELYLLSLISLFAMKSNINTLATRNCARPVAEQVGLNLTWSQTPNTGFLGLRPKGSFCPYEWCRNRYFRNLELHVRHDNATVLVSRDTKYLVIKDTGEG